MCFKVRLYTFSLILVFAFVSSGCTAVDSHYLLPDAQFIEGDSEPLLSGSFTYDGNTAAGQGAATHNSATGAQPATGLLYVGAVLLAIPLFTSMLICWGETPAIFCNL